MPGVGHLDRNRSSLRSVTAYDFHSAGHLAAYAGIAPVTRRSGSSIRGELPARSGNKRLKNKEFFRKIPPHPVAA
nr:IS110 family transposase [Corynebacterium lactis]